MNKVILMGNLGGDPDTRYLPSGDAVTQISVATNRTWKNRDTGEKEQETSWHRCVCFGQQAENIAKYFHKGSKILVEGRLKYGSYEKDGVVRYTTDVVIDRFHFVESKSGDRPPHAAERVEEQPQRQEQPAPKEPDSDDFDDDIPF